MRKYNKYLLALGLIQGLSWGGVCRAELGQMSAQSIEKLHELEAQYRARDKFDIELVRGASEQIAQVSSMIADTRARTSVTYGNSILASWQVDEHLIVSKLSATPLYLDEAGSGYGSRDCRLVYRELAHSNIIWDEILSKLDEIEYILEHVTDPYVDRFLPILVDEVKLLVDELENHPVQSFQQRVLTEKWSWRIKFEPKADVPNLGRFRPRVSTVGFDVDGFDVDFSRWQGLAFDTESWASALAHPYLSEGSPLQGVLKWQAEVYNSQVEIFATRELSPVEACTQQVEMEASVRLKVGYRYSVEFDLPRIVIPGCFAGGMLSLRPVPGLDPGGGFPGGIIPRPAEVGTCGQPEVIELNDAVHSEEYDFHLQLSGKI